jgi:hypothetical protein
VKRLLAVTVLLIAPITEAGFFVDSGETGFEFLKIPMAARAAALGNTFTAMSGDVSALEYNPAGITGLERLDINVSHQIYFEEATLNAVAAAYPFYLPFLGPSKLGPNGDDAGNLSVGISYKEFHANDDRRDASGIPIGELTIRDQAIQGSVAYDATAFSMGASWKYIKDTLDNISRNNSAADVGLLIKPIGGWRLGASILNVGPSKKFVEAEDPLPTTVRVGAAKSTKKWNFLFDLAQTRDKQSQPSAGIEYSINPYLTVRGGGRYHTSFEAAGGLGVRFADFGENKPYAARPEAKPSNEARRTLGNSRASTQSAERDRANGSIAFGIDYAFRTHETLGVVHTFTLKIMY